MSKNSWISKEDYCTIFHLVKSGTPNDEIAQLTRKSQRTIKRARNYLNRAYSGTLSPDAADRENQNLRIWALDFARKHPITDIQAHPQVSAKSDAIDPDDVLALFLAQFFTEVFFLAANNTSSLPLPAVRLDEEDASFLAWRLGGMRTAIYSIGMEKEYLKWRKNMLRIYDIDEELKKLTKS